MENKNLTPEQQQKLVDIIVRISICSPSEVVAEADLRNDLGMDSLDYVELDMDIEKEFGITIEDEILEAVRTVKDVFEAVSKLL